MKFIIITIIIILFPINTLLSQTREEILSYREIMKPVHQVDKYIFAREVNNELEGLYSGLFLFYKKMISSQDAVSCVFTPSCSVYALQSIQKKGLFLGTFYTFDRLTRCNRFSPEKYHMHTETMLFDDPVE